MPLRVSLRERVAQVVLGGLQLLFLDGAVADDQVEPAVVGAVLLHDEGERLAEVGVLRAGGKRLAEALDLGVRAKGTLAADRDLVAALDLLLDLAVEGEAAVEGAAKRLVLGDDGGGLGHVGLGEEVVVLLHRHERHLDVVAALDGDLAVGVGDVLDRQEADELGVDVQRHVGLADAHDARRDGVARVEALAVVLELAVQKGGEVGH